MYNRAIHNLKYHLLCREVNLLYLETYNLYATTEELLMIRVQGKERTKAMKLVLECCEMRFQIIDSQSSTKEFTDYAEKVKTDEQINAKVGQELATRERILQPIFIYDTY